MLRYLRWRATTLNLIDPLNSSFSIGLLVLELLLLSGSSIQLLLTFRLRDRKREADQAAIAVLEGCFLPAVDILVPTYNESVQILRRTLVGCQAIDYPNKTIYLLDDTNRSEMRHLAAELGCAYIARHDNRHAKAGNLNHALMQTEGDLIAVFDADFVPTQNFLTRTVGFFQSAQTALVQTPQSFYNADAIARNLGLEGILTPEEEVFYRQIQPLRDGSRSLVCAGTSFVVRRSCLEEIGGFVTDSISEDYFTGIRLSAQGYELVYLNEKLSAGLAAETIASHAIQRLRWARGTLQAFFIDANPLTIPGLTLLQRLAHLEGILHWFTSFSRIGFLLMPLACSFLGVIPIRATLPELLNFFFPYYLVNLTVFSWLNQRSRSAVLSDIYSLVLAFPIAWTVIQVLAKPFSKGFQVTPKEILRDRNSINWQFACPLGILFVLTACGLWQSLFIEASVTQEQNLVGVQLGWLWSSYNLTLLGISLLIMIDAPKRDLHQWLNVSLPVQLHPIAHTWIPVAGSTERMSEGGARLVVPDSPALKLMQPVTLEILETGLRLSGRITGLQSCHDALMLDVGFDPLSLLQYRDLVVLLFCRPGGWKTLRSPGELRSLLLLFKILFQPRVLCCRRNSAIRVLNPKQGQSCKSYRTRQQLNDCPRSITTKL
jgi:cellulose synthase (UDP-forming)